MSNYFPKEVWDEIIYPFPNFNGMLSELSTRNSDKVMSFMKKHTHNIALESGEKHIQSGVNRYIGWCEGMF